MANGSALTIVDEFESKIFDDEIIHEFSLRSVILPLIQPLRKPFVQLPTARDEAKIHHCRERWPFSPLP